MATVSPGSGEPARLKLSAGAIWKLLKRTASEWIADKAPRLGAALAYYTVFSIAPLVIIAASVAGLAFGREAAEGRIVQEIQGLVGKESALMIQSVIRKFSEPSHGIIATVIGIGTILFGAIGLFSELQDALNTIWGVARRPGAGIWATVRDYSMSFAMVLVIGFLLLVSLVISALLAALGTFIGEMLPAPELILQIVNFAISFGVVTLLFAMMFKFLPDAEIQWRDVRIGAVVTSLLFTVGKSLIGLYLGKSSVTSAFGAAGSLVVVLVWVYYSSQILLFGAEFTRVYANWFGEKIRPTSRAIFEPEKQRVETAASRKGAGSGDGSAGDDFGGGGGGQVTGRRQGE